MSKIDFFFVVEKKLLKADKRNDSKEARRTFRRKHYRHFQKKKDRQFKTHKNGESISENKILKHENRLLLHPALSMQLLTD